MMNDLFCWREPRRCAAAVRGLSDSVKDCRRSLFRAVVLLVANVVGCLLCFVVFLQPLRAAEDVFLPAPGASQLLQAVADLNAGSDPALFISIHYALLPLPVQEEVKAHRSKYEVLIPRYQVARTAADSAELSAVLDAMDVQWAAIRAIHINKFMPEAVELLDRAYDRLLRRR
jgi:hypothetical protein